MKLARVRGTLVSTIKTHSHENFKMMVVEEINEKGEKLSDSFLAIDCSQAGVGDIVLVLQEGSSCRQVMNVDDGAVDAVIVGIIDYVQINNSQLIIK